MMKLNPDEKAKLSQAIDQMNESLDEFIELYNEAEEDKEVIVFDEEVMELVKLGKEAIGEEALTKKINSIIKEVLSFMNTKQEKE
ncbi:MULTISPECIES: atypical membrane-integrating protein (Mistic protein) [Bacillus]|uniref:atypical membrane-integrating protein (Mistic protein) n=1 Tax=Bacillus TaxID=1386 RepID=UPI001D0D5303|nr:MULTISPECIES: atypical membrane-integrating protein (Mistic protein) [Bacillus]